MYFLGCFRSESVDIFVTSQLSYTQTHTRNISILVHTFVFFRRRYTTEQEESLSNDHMKEGTDVLKQKLMKRCRAEELVDRQLESIFRYT